MRSARSLALAACVALLVASASLPVAAHVNHVAADPQVTPDGTVVVESAFIASDGFLAVQRDDGGAPGEVIGHTRLPADAGFTTDVRVEIDDAAWETWNGPRTVHLVLRNDDGDGAFDPAEDPIVRGFGQPAEDVVPVAKGDRALVTARRFSPQRTEEGDVTIRHAALPESGYLVVENATSGTVLGSTALAAGSHANVSVALDDRVLSRDRIQVRAVVHVDDGDGMFDDGDAPVTVAGEPVATRFSVRPASTTGNDTVTPTPSLVTTATPFPNGSATASETGTPTSPGESTPSAGQPGFGLLAALAAFAGVVLLARRQS